MVANAIEDFCFSMGLAIVDQHDPFGAGAFTKSCTALS